MRLSRSCVVLSAVVVYLQAQAPTNQVSGLQLLGKLPGDGQQLFTFSSIREGWAWENRRLWITENGGASWRETKSSIATGPGDWVIRVFPSSARLARLWTKHGLIFETDDGGEKWVALKAPPFDPDPGHNYSLLGLEFDGSHGWAAVGVDFVAERGIWLQEEIYLTIDGARSWFRTWKGTSPWNAYHRAHIDSFEFADSNTGVAFGGAALLRTKDGGRTWTEVASCQLDEAPEYEPNPITEVRFIDDKRVWLVMSKGSIFRTEDGGTTWARIVDGPHSPVTEGGALSSQLCMESASHGWMIGSNGKLFETDDGGNRWLGVRGGVKKDDFGYISGSRVTGCRISDYDGNLYGDLSITKR